MKSNPSENGPRSAAVASLLLLVLVTMSALSATVGVQTDTVSLGPENGLVVSMEKRGAKLRILRRLSPPSTVSPPTTTPATTASSSSSQPPVSSSTSTASSSATTVTPAPMQTTAEVNVSLVALRELDANGKTIKNDSSFRSFTGFTDQNFTVTLLPDSYIPNSKIRSAALKANTTLSPPFLGCSVSVDAYVAKDNGTVAMGDETMTLTQGQLKVNVGVKGWNWCDGACAGSPAKFLEAEFLIQGRTVKDASQDQSYGSPERFSLGKDAWAEFSRKVNVDGSWRNLTDGYPKLSTSGSSYFVTVRFPRFNSSVSYDVSFEPGYTPSDKGGGPVGCAKVILPQFYNLLLTSLSLVLVKMIAA